ncbi:MAG: amidohydrolase family protein [Actinomycetes bacterium]
MPGIPDSSLDLAELAASVRLVDHHVHGALADDPGDVDDLGRHLAETDRPAPPGVSWWDSQLGFALRRWCAPVLDLPAYAGPVAYTRRRLELGAAVVNRRFLSAAGVDRFLVDTGYRGGELLGPAGMAAASGARTAEVIRLESVAEEVGASGVSAAQFADRFVEALWARSADAVGVKSVLAYRYGLDIDPTPPDPAEVRAAAGAWLSAAEASGTYRVSDPVLLRRLLWAAVDRGLPIQVHTGFGDPDLDLHRSDPALLTGFIRAVEPRGVDVLLLHCYPYHRHAGYLARVFPHVYLDVGLGVTYLGARADSLVAESLELAPFGKLLYSSDAWGPAELHYLGALLWRRAIAAVLGRWVDDDRWSSADARRVIDAVAAGNARRVYHLEES